MKWLKEQFNHKMEHLRWSKLKKTLKEHGLALLIIIVAWEIIEDVLFPILFIWLGANVHPSFYAGAPIAWILCLHWLAVPLMWGLWIKITNKKKKKLDNCCEHDTLNT
tara:strand:+ start:410 stop:733 length:324 start_codon:yes stop_codon:yes gene_type:complete